MEKYFDSYYPDYTQNQEEYQNTDSYVQKNIKPKINKLDMMPSYYPIKQNTPKKTDDRFILYFIILVLICAIILITSSYNKQLHEILMKKIVTT